MAADDSEERGAVLQIEIDTKRWMSTKENGDFSAYYNGETPAQRIFDMAKTAASDTIRNGGTFVLVARPGKVTMVQRPDWDVDI